MFQYTTPKKVSVTTQQYYNGAYVEKTVYDFTTKIIQRKKNYNY